MLKHLTNGSINNNVLNENEWKPKRARGKWKKTVAIERLGEEHMDRMWIFFFTLVYKNVYITVIVGQKSYGFIYW